VPFISVIVPTMRAGGIDHLMDTLAQQTFTDFELVLVDGLYERRQDIVYEEAQNRFLCVRHVGLSPNPFPVCSFCQYANAGIVASTGEVLLFAVDYSRFPKDHLAKHAAFHEDPANRKRGLMAPHHYVPLVRSQQFPVYGRPDVDHYEVDIKAGKLDRYLFTLTPEGDNVTEGEAGNHLADGGAIVPADCDPKLRMPPGRIGPEFFHAKNESVRREHVLAIDGWDTELDGAHLYQDSDFSDRLSTLAGVEWHLDPTAVLDIANPRHIFPFARRLRDHQENYVIWQRKKVAGYPGGIRALEKMKVTETHPEAPLPVVRQQRVDIVPLNKLRVAMIYGEFSRPGEPFDPDLFAKEGLTGSESSFFNTAISLSERGHEVVVFAKSSQPYEHKSGMNVMPLPALMSLKDIPNMNAVIAWNEPDYLKFAPPQVKRIVNQQLNDWGYCREPGWQSMIDTLVFPSESSRANHRKQPVISEVAASWEVIPNSCNLEFFGNGPKRIPNRVVWASSPDRGLHHLLEIWPLVRSMRPDAELRIFYRIQPVLDRLKLGEGSIARRMRYVAAALPKLERMGVKVIGPVANRAMAVEYQSAGVLAYPCDPVSYTEGFGCTVLDACAGGCLPVISNADALPEVHGGAAIVMGDLDRQKWATAIVDAMGGYPQLQTKMKQHAENHRRETIVKQWEELICADR
jgi:glycosyltransferase involved in cell wall biosynthesis